MRVRPNVPWRGLPRAGRLGLRSRLPRTRTPAAWAWAARGDRASAGDQLRRLATVSTTTCALAGAALALIRAAGPPRWRLPELLLLRRDACRRHSKGGRVRLHPHLA